MLTNDSHNWYNSRIIERHQERLDQCAEWAEHYNFLSYAGVTESDRAQFQEEFTEYLCYDV